MTERSIKEWRPDEGFERRLEIHFEWTRRFVLGLAGEGLREVGRLMDEAVEESELETLWLATSRRRYEWRRNRGTDRKVTHILLLVY